MLTLNFMPYYLHEYRKVLGRVRVKLKSLKTDLNSQTTVCCTNKIVSLEGHILMPQIESVTLYKINLRLVFIEI